MKQQLFPHEAILFKFLILTDCLPVHKLIRLDCNNSAFNYEAFDAFKL